MINNLIISTVRSLRENLKPRPSVLTSLSLGQYGKASVILDPRALFFYHVTDGNKSSAFSSPEAALLLVSTKNRDLWPPQRSNECACLSRARARVGMDCTISIETSSAKMAADLNFAVCVSFREDKPKTKQLRFLL